MINQLKMGVRRGGEVEGVSYKSDLESLDSIDAKNGLTHLDWT